MEEKLNVCLKKHLLDILAINASLLGGMSLKCPKLFSYQAYSSQATTPHVPYLLRYIASIEMWSWEELFSRCLRF